MSTPLVVHDWSECCRLLGGAPVASIELHRHRLPKPLTAGCTLEGTDIALTLDAPSAAALIGSDVSVSTAVADTRTAATWRVVAIGTAQAHPRGIRLRPSSVLGFCVSLGPLEAAS